MPEFGRHQIISLLYTYIRSDNRMLSVISSKIIMICWNLRPETRPREQSQCRTESDKLFWVINDTPWSYQRKVRWPRYDWLANFRSIDACMHMFWELVQTKLNDRIVIGWILSVTLFKFSRKKSPFRKWFLAIRRRRIFCEMIREEYIWKPWRIVAFPQIISFTPQPSWPSTSTCLKEAFNLIQLNEDFHSFCIGSPPPWHNGPPT